MNERECVESSGQMILRTPFLTLADVMISARSFRYSV